ncbi:MAG: hypothetical protein QOG85_394 [Gaiellaceae bacterium]|nr:hypothetical protein [Gaiellaceae bacterium]
MLLAEGLTTGHKVALIVVAAVFIAFALGASFVAPKKRPDFPGPNGLSVFVIASLLMFVLMVLAINFFG